MKYFKIISDKIMTISKIIIPIISLAFGGFILGKSASKNGWIEGLKIGLIITIIILICNLIFASGINLKDLVLYGVLIISSMFGSMAGINLKKL